MLDGVYLEDDTGTLRFHEAEPPTDDEMDRLLQTIDRRIHRLLARRGVLDDLGEGSTADPWREEAPVLAGIAGAYSVADLEAAGFTAQELAAAGIISGGAAPAAPALPAWAIVLLTALLGGEAVRQHCHSARLAARR